MSDEHILIIIIVTQSFKRLIMSRVSFFTQIKMHKFWQSNSFDIKYLLEVPLRLIFNNSHMFSLMSGIDSHWHAEKQIKYYYFKCLFGYFKMIELVKLGIFMI